MKKIIFKSTLIVVFSFLIFQSCTKDFLITEQRGVTPQEKFYKTDEEALQGVMAVYNNFRNFSSSYMQFNLNLSDECYAGGGGRGEIIGQEELNELRFGTNNSVLQTHYSGFYSNIYLCNKVIDNVDNATEAKKTIVAEAKVWRAFDYYQLATLWGRVPLVLHELSPTEYVQPRVDDINKVWAQIEKDLTEAIPDLPLKSTQGANVFRISKGYAQALYGKILLFQKKYDQAAGQLAEVINSGQFGLYQGDKYVDIFKKEQEFGIESLFELSFYSDVSLPQGSNFYYVFVGPRVGTCFSGDLGLDFLGFGQCAPKVTVYNAFVSENDIFRKNGSIMNEAELGALHGTLRLAGGNLQYGGEGVIKLKYANYSSETTEPDPPAHYGTNLRMMRYSDVLLMAAEAYNKASSPNDAKAKGYLNQVRDRAKLPNVTSAGDALFQAIKKERRLEFCFEAGRYQDLLRWGDAASVMADQGHFIPKGDGTNYENSEYGFKEKHKLLPFPQAELLVNEKIAADQNPGW